MDALIMVAYHRGNIRPEAPLVNAGENKRVAESIAGITTTGGTYNAGIAARSRKVADLYLHGTYPAPKRTRSQLKAAGIQLVKDRYPDRLNTVGNNFGRPTEPAQKQQAAQAYQRMTGGLP